MQGRLFSFRTMVISAVAPIAYISSGFLSDHFFEPLMLEESNLSELMGGHLLWLGELYGYGKGRGVAVLISLYGLFCFCCLFFALSSRRIRGVDADLPDCNEEESLAKSTNEFANNEG